jgi:hypothetical protein
MNLSVEHPNNLTALIADNLPLLHIVQRRHREPPLILRIHGEVNVSQMRKLVHRVRRYVLARRICILWCREAPTFLLHVPVNTGI